MPPKISEESLASISGIADAVRSSLALSPYRRLSNTPEAEVDTRVLCQSLHVNRLEGEPKLLLGDEQEGSWMHSVVSVAPAIEASAALGIRRIYLGLGAADPSSTPLQNLERFVEIVARVRKLVGTDLELLVDPAGLCMRPDLRWGVTAANGDVDAHATAELLARAAVELAEAGMDALVTIGRLNCEVEVAKSALARASRRVKIMSFSTNSETASAYFDKTRDDITRARTGQKILVGNGHEMTLRALGDFGEGADVIVQKPIEATHSVVMLRMLATGQLSPASYLENTPEIQRMLAYNPWLRPAIDRAAAALTAQSRPLRTGGYEVSGTYCMTHTLMRTYSDQLAFAMLDEVYKNLASAAGSTLDIIITRAASWYLRQRARFAGPEKVEKLERAVATKRATFFVVGDQYERFAQNADVVTASELQRRIATGTGNVPPASVVVGQGLRREEIAALERSGVSTLKVEPSNPPAPLGLTHKREEKNVLITTPRKIGPGKYTLELMLDDGLDRLSDHVTGQHIGGMLQIEAARQAGIASVELELLAGKPERYGFTWSGLSVDFLRFAFPLPMQIDVTIGEQTSGDPPKTVPYALMEIFQGGQLITRMRMEYQLIKWSTLERIEAKAAARAIEAARAQRDEEDAEEKTEIAV